MTDDIFHNKFEVFDSFDLGDGEEREDEKRNVGLICSKQRKLNEQEVGTEQIPNSISCLWEKKTILF